MKLKFREMNPVTVGLVGIGAVLLVLFGSFQVASLPLFAGTTYKALFTEAGGLKTGDQVKVAGTQVGKVTDIEVAGPRVEVSFTAKDVILGKQTTAEIKTQTLLGQRDLGISPRGDGALSSGETIPANRTKSPYSVSDSLEDLTHQTGEIDDKKVGQALDTFSETFQNTPQDIGPAFDGITRLSRTIASRDEALRALLRRAESVTGILKDHTGQLTQIVRDGTQLLDELESRRTAIHQLLTTATQAANQANGFVREQRTILTPALDKLNGAISVLQRNEGNIASSIQRVSQFITGLGEGLSTSPQFTGIGDLGALPPTVFPTSDFIPRLALPGGEPPPPPSPLNPMLPSLGDPFGVGGDQ